ncbi:MAG TPA: type IV secretory system conjugative DNA transfer family protein, partial [Candidatus Portnoybacteria bacterium]|nr:type IV secretory system conjugative DNA transfer family protein [Candidatus Portnoybacteria bacterium]
MCEHYFRNAMLTLMADKNDPGTIAEIPRILTDDEFTKYKVSQVKDPMVRSFWEKEWARITEQTKSEMLGYLISKIGAFVENEMMRNIIGQARSGFDFREVMDNSKILLVNLSKGKLGELNSALLGLIIVSKLQMGAMARVDIPQEQRKDFYLYIDEFQNFTTESIATVLAEARKYRLCLIIAHQFIGQLEEKIRDSVFGNVGSMVSFRLGPDDAEFMAKQFEPVFNESDLINIDNFNA